MLGHTGYLPFFSFFFFFFSALVSFGFDLVSLRLSLLAIMFFSVLFLVCPRLGLGEQKENLP